MRAYRENFSTGIFSDGGFSAWKSDGVKYRSPQIRLGRWGCPGKGHPGVFKNDKIAFRDRIRTAHAIAIAMHRQSIQAFMPLYAIWGCISLYYKYFVIYIQHYSLFAEHSCRVWHIEF